MNPCIAYPVRQANRADVTLVLSNVTLGERWNGGHSGIALHAGAVVMFHVALFWQTAVTPSAPLVSVVRLYPSLHVYATVSWKSVPSACAMLFFPATGKAPQSIPRYEAVERQVVKSIRLT